MSKIKPVREFPNFHRNPYKTRPVCDYYIRAMPAAINLLPLLNRRAIHVLSFVLRNMTPYNGNVILRREDVLTQYPNLVGDSFYAGLQDLLHHGILARSGRHDLFFVNQIYFKRLNIQSAFNDHV